MPAWRKTYPRGAMEDISKKGKGGHIQQVQWNAAPSLTTRVIMGQANDGASGDERILDLEIRANL